MGICEKFRVLAAAVARECAIAGHRCPCCLAPFQPGESGSGLCPDCLRKLGPYRGPRCVRCGLPLGASGAPEGAFQANGLCGDCLQNPPPFGRCAYYGLYSGMLRELILRFKFHNHYWLGGTLGHFLVEASICLPEPDALIAVPQHERHLEERGFNQAHELARAAGRLGGWPLLSRGLRRHVKAGQQARLPASERKRNVAGSFSAESNALAGMRLWLIDDIVTTGNTAIAAAGALLEAGAREVNVLCVARTPRSWPMPRA